MNAPHERTPALDPAAERALARHRDAGGGAHVEHAGRMLLNFASDDALGLSTDPRVTRAACDAAARWGVGAGSAALITGRLAVHEDLERALAERLEVEQVLLYSSGWEASVEAVAALTGEGDAVCVDACAHPGLARGARLSGAALHTFAHRDVAGLEAALQRTGDAGWRVVATDGVFADRATLAPLGAMANAAGRASALLVVHDGAGMGVIGPDGRGAAQHAGVAHRVALTVGSLSRALGSQGGYVAGPSSLILRIAARSSALRDSTALAPPLAAAALAALGIAIREPGRRASLERHAARLREDLTGFGLSLAGDLEVPRVIVRTGGTLETLALSDHLEAAGVLALPLVPPRVEESSCGLLLAPMATHTDTDMEDVHMAFASAPPDLLPRGRG
jgi:7-keto-8-aminopelargonate synthetase-like enzyme